MKKIFRMALVFALAGATLMYTGCTKDYSEDINKLDTEISSLEDEYKALSDELNTLKSGVSSLEAAYKAADTALESKFAGQIADLEKNLNGKIDEIQKAIDKKADKAEVEKAIADAKADAIKAANELQAALDAVKAQLTADEAKIAANEAKLAQIEEAQKNLDDAMAAFSNELRALVFVPDFYFGGVEATSYSASNFIGYKLNATKDPYTFGNYTFPKGTKLGDWSGKVNNKDYTGKEIEQVEVNKQKVDYYYVSGQKGIARYDINPSTFPLDSNVKWSFNYDNVMYITKDGETKEWKPKFESISYDEDGYAKVEFSIENPELMVSSMYEIYDGTNREWRSSNVPIIQLQANIGDKEIASDWAAVLNATDYLQHLVFTKDSSYYTNYSCGALRDEKGGKILYTDAEWAVMSPASIKWKYNAGELDFADIIKIHMYETMTGTSTEGTYGEEELTFAEFSEKYPGFKMSFEEVPYTIGKINTSEDAYSNLDGSVFTPCMVDEAGNSIIIEKGADYGISAAGRFPLFMVTLTDPNGKVSLFGYFKVEIATEVQKTDINSIDIKDFGKLPLLCNNADSTTWSEFSAKVLENLKVDYNQFRSSYKIVNSSSYYNFNSKSLFVRSSNLYQGSSYDAQIFVKNDKGEYEIVYVLDEEGKPTDEELNLGTITYSVDYSGTGVNDMFKWSFDKAAAQNIDKYHDVYVRFQISDYNVVYFKFSADIAEPAEITYGKINPTYWFADVEDDLSTVRANVLIPSKTDDDVTDFTKTIDDYFAENVLKVQLKEGADSVYANYFNGKTDAAKGDPKDMETKYEYKFAAEQPVINKKQLLASEDGLKLYVAKYDNKGKIVTEKVNGNDVPVLDDANLIATMTAKVDPEVTVDDKQKVTYSNESDIAKKLLNLWDKSAASVDSMLYANIQVNYTAGAGDCVVAADSSVFYMRFIRPVTVSKGNAAELQDGIPGGDVMTLGQLISASDWNDNVTDPIFAWDATNKFTRAYTYKTAANNEIIWAEYYGFESIKVDFENVMTDQLGKDQIGKLSVVNPSAILQLQDAAGNVVTSGVAPINTIEDYTVGTGANAKTYKEIKGLDDYKIYYFNNNGVSKDFNLQIPVILTYSWGEISTIVNVKVIKTY